VVCSYINPDLDGVACSIAAEILEHPKWSACVLGALDAETSLVLHDLGFTFPPSVNGWDAVDEIWLVDTHHASQLPPDLPESRVTRITDHHSGGNPSRYANADIQNENVGAAATLVAERFLDSNVTIPVDVAMLLQAAIVSNSLNFRAPATSPRDRNAYANLRNIKPLPDTMFDRMQEARRATLHGETRSILRADTKRFETDYGSVIVSQLEAAGALELLGRMDLKASLEELAEAADCASAILNVVDTALGCSAVLATDSRIANRVSEGLHQSQDGDGVIRTERLLQRKSDIVPHIMGIRS
jgi:manganese-dependent inorganic pyrophosphatase